MFVPYSRITASVSLYTTSRSPFLPVCLTSRRPLTIFFSLRPISFPYFSLLFLSFFSPLSYPAHISLSYFSHFSHIPHRRPPLSQNRKLQSQTRKRSRRQIQAIPAVRKIKNRPGNSNTRKQAGADTGQEAQGRYRARQDNIRYRKGQAKAGRQKVAAVRKTAERQQDLSRLPPHTSAAHTAPLLFRPCGAAG